MEPRDLISLMRTWGWRLKKAGITQSDLAEELGISVQYCNKIINNKSEPKVKLFVEIETILREAEHGEVV